MDIPPQEDRSTLSHWNAWLPAQIEIARGELDKLAEDDDTSNNDLINLWAIQSLMQLPVDVVIAARKRLFAPCRRSTRT